ncbi:MAG: LysR substrate-binding domain-containing protein [Pseudomonadota bacterium]
MDRIAAMRAFLAVAEAQGFAPAARKLGLATSSLTRQVDALEAHLGTQLLNRSTRAVTLTETGETYRHAAAHALDTLREADASVAEADGPPSGLLRVSLPVAFARLVVAPTLGAFAEAYPGIVLEITATDSMVNLVDERLDVAIRLGPPGEGSLIARKLAAHRRVLCAAPDLIARAGRPGTPENLAGLPCLIFTQATTRSVWRFRREAREVAVEVHGPLRATNSELLREAALTGAGYLLMPTWLVGLDIRAGALEPVLPDWEVADGGGAIHAVTLPNRRGSRKVAAFVDHLRAAIGDPPLWERGLI